MKKGEISFEKIGNLILVVLGLIILIFLIYYFRDKAKDLIEVILNALK